MKTIIPSEFICHNCKKLRKSSEFLSDRVVCKECSKPDPEVKRAKNLVRKYGITIEQYNEMFHRQGGVCACCKQEETLFDKRTNAFQKLSVDHDHKTGKVRGLLCNRCNTAVGLVEDDTQMVIRLLEYMMYIKSE